MNRTAAIKLFPALYSEYIITFVVANKICRLLYKLLSTQFNIIHDVMCCAHKSSSQITHIVQCCAYTPRFGIIWIKTFNSIMLIFFVILLNLIYWIIKLGIYWCIKFIALTPNFKLMFGLKSKWNLN